MVARFAEGSNGSLVLGTLKLGTLKELISGTSDFFFGDVLVVRAILKPPCLDPVREEAVKQCLEVSPMRASAAPKPHRIYR